MTSKSQTKNLFFKSLTQLTSATEAENYCKDIMTPGEIEAFSDRLLVAFELSAGKSQRQVASETQVSLATVTRVNRFLTRGFGGYKLILNRLHHHSDSALAQASGD